MSGRKENGESSLQEVHRLLKKFDEIREQRAKKCIRTDMKDKRSSRYDRGDYDRLMQLQVTTKFLFERNLFNSNLFSTIQF